MTAPPTPPRGPSPAPTEAPPPPRDPWGDIAWGVARGIALGSLPLLLSVLPGRLPVSPQQPRLIGSPEASFGILALGAGLGAVAGLLRPLTRTLVGSLVVGLALSETTLLLLRWLLPARADRPPPQPFGPVLGMGLVLGLALYFGELHRRGARSSLAG